MDPSDPCAKLIAALEGVAFDLAGIEMPMEDYARITNKIAVVVGAAKEGSPYLLDYRRDES